MVSRVTSPWPTSAPSVTCCLLATPLIGAVTGVTQVDPRGGHGGFGLLTAASAVRSADSALSRSGLGDELLRRQSVHGRPPLRWRRSRGPRPAALRRIERGTQRRRVDQEGLALLDLRAFLVDALEQHARHPRASALRNGDGGRPASAAAAGSAAWRRSRPPPAARASAVPACSQRDSNGARQGKWCGHQEELRGWFVDGAPTAVARRRAGSCRRRTAQRRRSSASSRWGYGNAVCRNPDRQSCSAAVRP